MKSTETINMHRRKFLLSSSFLLSATAVLETSSLLGQTLPVGSPSGSPKGPDLSEALSPEELARVKESVMSEDMQNFWHKGYSCAETGLMVALRFMKKPEDLVWAASGFAGGLMHQDLCGFLTSGVMAIGLHAGDLKEEKNAAMMKCSQAVNEYWAWWQENAPIHCAEIREGREPMDFKVCERLGRLATAKVESLLIGTPQKAST
ncbi:MAG: C_GCAxxG_C_C family protein [Acidobacteria bacterium]|nr:C_GCAxxG_C_C family protein [Acidobacteriota bacterium]